MQLKRKPRRNAEKNSLKMFSGLSLQLLREVLSELMLCAPTNRLQPFLYQSEVFSDNPLMYFCTFQQTLHCICTVSSTDYSDTNVCWRLMQNGYKWSDWHLQKLFPR